MACACSVVGCSDDVALGAAETDASTTGGLGEEDEGEPEGGEEGEPEGGDEGDDTSGDDIVGGGEGDEGGPPCGYDGMLGDYALVEVTPS